MISDIGYFPAVSDALYQKLLVLVNSPTRRSLAV